MKLRGEIFIEREFEDSKSEGCLAFLRTDDGSVYQLYRPGVYPVDDSYFQPFNGLEVEAEGEMEECDYFVVSNIVQTLINDVNENGKSM